MHACPYVCVHIRTTQDHVIHVQSSSCPHTGVSIARKCMYVFMFAYMCLKVCEWEHIAFTHTHTHTHKYNRVLHTQHIRAGCPSAQVKTKQNACTFKGCREKEFVPINCKLCKKPFCLKHRFEADHDCPVNKKAGNSAKLVRLLFSVCLCKFSQEAILLEGRS